jgi:hypothetical protein
MSNPNPFNLTPKEPIEETDIETLFLDLKGRSENIQYLRSIQADVLRDYYTDHKKSKNVGIELPTGSGKTLVGLLIAEWRRRFLKQRILYLCPTRQLANQVHDQSKEYGIDTCIFIGSKKYYNPAEISKYQRSETIAISTYSGLFNYSPGINDPQTIILDDAHGAESYIGDMWSLKIDRIEHSDLYNRVLEIFEKDLPERFVEVIHSGNRFRVTHFVEKIPFGAFYRSLNALRNVLDTIDDSDLSLFFSWKSLSDGLHACHVYVSFNSILIRPYIPPTLHHRPFADAEQRVYMSATLGKGGELERITGVNRIERIATPNTYKKRGVGRRFYIFPDYALGPEEYYPWVIERLSLVDRNLILCPSGYRAKRFVNFVKQHKSPFTIFSSTDIEDTLQPFLKSNLSLLVLTNRYDGLDLPGGVCKQVIIDGLPSGVNLQEAFLEERLKIDVLLRERIKTRIQQASGRCTRADLDSAAILMLDRKLFNFCARTENLQIFHPELRAEISFSLQQPVKSLDNMDAMLESFLNKDENWERAEHLIENYRKKMNPAESQDTTILDKVVDFEVDFSYAIWSKDYQKAVERGRRIADELKTQNLNAYRALWYYFVAAAAMTAPPELKEYEKIKSQYIRYAKAAGRLISWFPNALKSMESVETEPEENVERRALAVEGVIDIIDEFGIVGPKFQKNLDEVESLINETDSDKFERGLQQLGRLLGYSSTKPPGKGAPDACWQLENNVLFIFEAKSDEKQENSISISNCRQSSSHVQYANDSPSYKNVDNKIICLITCKKSIDKDAVPHCKGVYYLHLSDTIKLFEKTKQMLIEARSILTSETNENNRELILEIMTRLELLPSDISTLITSRSIVELPQV